MYPSTQPSKNVTISPSGGYTINDKRNETKDKEKRDTKRKEKTKRKRKEKKYDNLPTRKLDYLSGHPRTLALVSIAALLEACHPNDARKSSPTLGAPQVFNPIQSVTPRERVSTALRTGIRLLHASKAPLVRPRRDELPQLSVLSRAHPPRADLLQRRIFSSSIHVTTR